MFIEKIVGDLGDKRRWRQYKPRVKALPASHRTTVEALERYLTYSGVITRGDVLMPMLEDFAGLFEQLVKAIERAEEVDGRTRS